MYIAASSFERWKASIRELKTRMALEIIQTSEIPITGTARLWQWNGQSWTAGLAISLARFWLFHSHREASEFDASWCEQVSELKGSWTNSENLTENKKRKARDSKHAAFGCMRHEGMSYRVSFVRSVDIKQVLKARWTPIAWVSLVLIIRFNVGSTQVCFHTSWICMEPTVLNSTKEFLL